MCVHVYEKKININLIIQISYSVVFTELQKNQLYLLIYTSI